MLRGRRGCGKDAESGFKEIGGVEKGRDTKRDGQGAEGRMKKRRGLGEAMNNMK